MWLHTKCYYVGLAWLHERPLKNAIFNFFRVFGIAVTDYDDISHDDTESETLDDDHVIGGDLEESSKNLFDSARGTCLEPSSVCQSVKYRA